MSTPATARRPRSSAARGTAPKTARPSAAARRRRAAQIRRRRRGALLAVATIVLAVILVRPLFDEAVRDLTLPLRHADVIREQARDKQLDASLIAGVIYAESHFRDGQRSHAGALGLMQLTPDTAHYIARKSGGIAFQIDDLATPRVNIAYGSYYLRYLLDRFDGSRVVALAAYNAGEGNVEKWMAERNGRFTPEEIPFAETRAYVRKVLEAQGRYRATYPAELGL